MYSPHVNNLARARISIYGHPIMPHPTRITVKDLMERYEISATTARRWRKRLRNAGVLVGASPKAHCVVGVWQEIDRAILLGGLEQPS